MNEVYSAYFIGLPLSQINLHVYKCAHILQDLHIIIKEILAKTEDNVLQHKIYNLDANSYLKEDGTPLHADTITFINWIQNNQKALKEMRFDLEAHPNIHGEAPYIFGRYVSVGLGGGNVNDACRVDLTRIVYVQKDLAKFSEILQNLDPAILAYFTDSNFICLWTNVQQR